MRQKATGFSDTDVTITPASRATPDSDDGRVLLHLETGRMCAINAMGSRIWTELDAGHTFQEIVDILAAEYDASRERIEADVRAFIEQLVTKDYARAPGGVG
jgi:hypothetical protein